MTDRSDTVKSEILVTVTIKIAVFWDVTPCGLIESIFRRNLLHPLCFPTLMAEARGLSETLVPTYHPTRRHLYSDIFNTGSATVLIINNWRTAMWSSIKHFITALPR
jgi:hypothetical protein